MRNALALVALAWSFVACAEPASGVRFAVADTSGASERSVEARAFRVLATRIDLRQPIFVRDNEGAVEVTYAVRQREGRTLRLDAQTLEQIGEATSFLYPRCSERDVSAHLTRDGAHVAAADGREVFVFTSDEHNRAFARVGDGATVPMTPEGMSIVGPARAAVKGREIVGVFVAATDDGFALVATSMTLFDVQR